MTKIIPLFAICFLLQSCIHQEDPQAIVDNAIVQHGWDQISGKKVTFDFRDMRYSVSYIGENKTYTRKFQNDSLGRIKDELVNSTEFKRYINDTLVDVGSEWAEKYKNSVNSVLYFFQLPLGLNDAAVKKEYLGKTFVNDQLYFKVGVTFKQSGGGKDFEDEFVYWFHAEKKTLDYLAYSYATDGGGMRFRQAVNRRKIKDILFQDYINFEPDSKKVALEDFDIAFVKGQMIQLSDITNEGIVVN